MGDLKELPAVGRARRFAVLEGGHQRVRTGERDGRRCIRHSWMLSEKLRTCECSVCGQIAAPYEVLLELVHDQDQILWMLRDRKHLIERIGRLKAEEKRAKDRLRHAKKRLSVSPPGEDHDAQKGGGPPPT